MGDFTFRMGCPLKRPMRVALTDHLRGVGSIRARVKPSRVQLAVSKPAQFSKSCTSARSAAIVPRATGA